MDSTHSEERLDHRHYITEVDSTAFDSKWWEGTVIRVGYFETQNIHFEWYTANLREFLEKHKKEHKAYLKRRPELS